MNAKNANVKLEEHKRMVTEYIQDVCDRTREKKLNIAEICLTKLQDGQYLEEAEVEEYAKENNLRVVGRFLIGDKIASVKICITKPLVVIPRK